MRLVRTLSIVVAVCALVACWLAFHSCDTDSPQPVDAERPSTTALVETRPRPHSAVVPMQVITGHVRSRYDGRELADVLVAVTQGTPCTHTGTDGRFELPVAELDDLRIAFKCEGYLAHEVAVPRERLDLGDVLLDPAAALRVRVVDQESTPLPDVRVEVVPTDFGRPLWRKSTVPWAEQIDATRRASALATGTTDADGELELPTLSAVGVAVVASKPGYTSQTSPTLDLVPGIAEDVVTLVLSPGHALDGVVLDEDGTPLADALVTAGESLEKLVRRTRTDDAGRFRLEGLPPGVTYLKAAPRAGLLVRHDPVRVPDLAFVELRMPATGRLSGRVVDAATDRGLAGLTLRLHVPPHGVVETEATADGQFELTGIPKGLANLLTANLDGWTLAPAQPGYVLTQGNMGPSLQIGEVAPASDLDLTVRMTPAASLGGVVRGPRGPVARARVFAKAVGRGFLEWGVTCDDQGRFHFPSMIAGPVLLYAEAPGLYAPDYPATTWMTLLRSPDAESRWIVTVPESGAIEHDVELVAGTTVRGQVRDMSGAGIAGARVVVSATAPETPRVVGTTREDGSFELPGAAPLEGMFLHATADGYAPSYAGPIPFIGEGAARMDVTLERTPLVRVTGRVSSAAGLPVTGGYVQLNAYSGDYPAVALAAWNRATRFPIATDGTYEATLTRGGFARLRVRAVVPGHADARSDWIDCPFGDDTPRRVDLTAEAGHVLTGGVVDGNTGAPLAGARIRLSTVLTGEHMYYWRSVEAVTDEHGRFRIEGVPPGELAVTALAHGYAEEHARLIVPETLNVELTPSRAEDFFGIVRWQDGRPVVGARVDLHPGERAVNGKIPPTHTRTSLDGSFRFPALFPGLYEVSVAPYTAGDAQFLPLRTEGHRTGQPVELVVRSGLAIAGRVVDPQGEPLEAVAVHIGNGSRTWTGETSPTGRFDVVGLSGGPFDVTVNPDGTDGGRDHAAATVEGVAADTHDLVVRLGHGLEIAGRVVDADGVGLAGLWLRIGRRRVMTDDRGRFRFRGLGAGRHSIAVADPPLGPRRHSVTSLDAASELEAGSVGVVVTAR